MCWALPISTAFGKDRVRIHGDVFSEYTDNLFHYSDARLAEFDLQMGPGERFENLDSSSDTVSRVRLRTDFNWRLRNKRDVRLSLDGAYYWHWQNDVANYAETSAGLDVDTSKRGRLSFEVGRTTDRFKKNYRLADSTLFDDASYDQTDFGVWYMHEMRKKGHWSLGGGYQARSRRFNAGFEGRDLDGDYVGVLTSYRLRRHARAETSIELGEVITGTELDAGVLIDRSYDQFRVTQAFSFDIGGDVDLEVELGFRRREFTSDVVLDGGRFDRMDDRIRLRVTVERKWKRGLTLRARSTVINADSDRVDSTVEIDEAGYDELSLGLGIGYRF
ncbi:MAG: hypothetical protein OEM23_04470 [Gemmatimonadota bacterium]|nr:hypothetical protein [Gemmatimonadota bacterium]